MTDTPLAAVLAAPADDIPRLVYADWQEEHSDPEWAAAVRVMCGEPHEFDAEVQVERMGGGRPTAAVAGVLGWLEDHAPHHLSMLLGGRRCDRVPGAWPWVTGCPSLGLVVEWRRGFVAQVRGPLAVVQEHLPRLIAGHPVERAGATDRVPLVVDAGRGIYWCAAKREWGEAQRERPPDGRVPAESLLPRPLFDRLPGDLRYTGYADLKQFPAADGVGGANTALSEAILAEARDAVA